MGSLQKPGFSRKNLVFSLDLQFFGSLKLLVIVFFCLRYGRKLPNLIYWVLAFVSFTMSFRSHLDHYCMHRAMAADPIATAPRSRSPPNRQPTSSRPSPLFRPPGWQPPIPQAHRPIVLQIDLKPMQQLALQELYYNILAPQVAGNIWKPFNIGIRQSIPSLQGHLPGLRITALRRRT